MELDNITLENLLKDKFSYKNLCGSCHSKPCCSDFAAPMLFTDDLKKLHDIDKTSSRFIEDLLIGDEAIKIIKKKENSNECIFWDDKMNFCSIYENRPYDCRMFPFDIDWVDGQFRWIIYSCNPNSDWSWTEQHIQKLESDPQFDEVMKHAKYFQLTSKDYVDVAKEPPYTILRKVNYNVVD